MSTRGAIARLKSVTPLAFSGAYHHWDSYPTGLGRALWSLFHGHFEKNLKPMLETLIDRHPAGWSSILHADFTREPGFCNPLTCACVNEEDTLAAPSCYCHGERNEEAWEVTEKNASGSGCEWAYVFTGECRMLVLSSYTRSGDKMIGMFGCGDEKAVWRTAAVVDLFGAEPDWDRIEGRMLPTLAAPAKKGVGVKVNLNGGATPALVQRDTKMRGGYLVQLPNEEAHHVTRAFAPAKEGGVIATFFCTCCDKESSATAPICLHAKAIEALLHHKGKHAQARVGRGLRYSGSRVPVYREPVHQASKQQAPSTQVMVLVWESGEPSLLDPRPSQRLRNHSPAGFEWGYGGSGPAQLALAILLDFTGDEELALACYQAFKAAHLAPLPRDAAWEITSSQLETFLLASNTAPT